MYPNKKHIAPFQNTQRPAVGSVVRPVAACVVYPDLSDQGVQPPTHELGASTVTAPDGHRTEAGAGAGAAAGPP